MTMTTYRVYLTAATVGQAFGTVGYLHHFQPGNKRHGSIVGSTDVKPHGFHTAALNAAYDLAERRGLTVVDYQP